MKLILASTSKLKSEIMNKAFMKHDMCESSFEEHSIKSKDVYEYVKKVSLGKAESVSYKVSEGIVLGIDTVCYIDGKIVEKPKTLEEAKYNLAASSNKTTSVITGITLINKYNNEVVNTYQETKITFNKIDDEDIEFYIQNEKDVMYVSGFVFEGVASNFLNTIEGSYYNILGVPVEKIYEILLSWGIHLKDLE